MEKFERIELIKKLSNAEGISGFEDNVLEIVKNQVNDIYNVERDSMNNLYINNIPKENRKKPLVMLEAHSDEVGFMVQSIEANGLLKFVPIGGWSSQQVQAHKVKVLTSNGKYLKGIISSTPVHFLKGDGKMELKDMFVDVGVFSYDEAIEKGIEIGSPIVPDVECEYLEDSKLFLGKSFDDRVGCAIITEVMKDLKNHMESLNVEVAGVLSSQEEVGLRGAIVSSQRVCPDLAIVLEAPPADDTFRNKYTSQGGLRNGVQIRHIDPTMIANPRFVKFIKDTAKKYNIKYQETVRESGGTNAGKIHLENLGIPTVVLGVPTRYAHSHHGFVSLEDYESTLELVKALLKELNEEIIKNF